MSEQTSRILVVDDEADIRANLQDILTDMDFEVDTAEDGPSALKLLKQHAYDVALLDLKMPGMDGLELYRRIKSMRSETVAIIVTAYASTGTAQEALDAGAWRILSKPVNPSQLIPLIDEALEQPLIMVIDDDQDLCETLWDIFREKGYRVALAHTAEEAGQKLRDKSTHVCLIDMKLPEGDGSQVFKTVRESNPEARTILVTGYQSELEQAVQRTLDEGADAVCYKPFDMERLISMLQEMVGQ